MSFALRVLQWIRRGVEKEFTDLTPNRHQIKIKHYGWKPSLPRLNVPVKYDSRMVVGILPPSVDLRSLCPPVYDQGQLGSCTANAIAGAIEFDMIRQKISEFTPSRLYIYYNERDIESDITCDCGANLADGIDAVSNLGFCPESEWPYDITQFAIKPSPQCFADGLQNKAISYARVANEIIPSVMKLCLSEGNPFVFGFTVYESFESSEVTSTGVVPMPQPTEKIIGGHAVLCVGYDDTKGVFICRNSWGSSWGQNGYFTIPYEYLTSNTLASDFWTIKVIS